LPHALSIAYFHMAVGTTQFKTDGEPARTANIELSITGLTMNIKQQL
jgi:hypothetical protein